MVIHKTILETGEVKYTILLDTVDSQGFFNAKLGKLAARFGLLPKDIYWSETRQLSKEILFAENEELVVEAARKAQAEVITVMDELLRFIAFMELYREYIRED